MHGDDYEYGDLRLWKKNFVVQLRHLLVIYVIKDDINMDLYSNPYCYTHICKIKKNDLQINNTSPVEDYRSVILMFVLYISLPTNDFVL